MSSRASWLLGIVMGILILGIEAFLFFTPRTILLRSSLDNTAAIAGNFANLSSPTPSNLLADIENQPPLPNPPSFVKAIYLTEWSANSSKKLDSLINLVKRTELNAMVIDLKDYTGRLAYKTGLQQAQASGAERTVLIPYPNKLIKRLHDENIYVIGRITVFEDMNFAKVHPEWALQDKTTDKVWQDSEGYVWLDPAAKPVWDYVVAIAKDALARGFDEINFDYVRFASDGKVKQISYPVWDGNTPKHQVIKSFFQYLRENLPDAKISADIFGQVTVSANDMGIGQILEDAYQYFDYVSPMVYPSHYTPGFIGYDNPAEHPYEVIKYSLTNALERLQGLEKVNSKVQIASNATPIVNSTATPTSTIKQIVNSRLLAKLRPWLQDFNMGATYNAEMVKKEIRAVNDVLGNNATAQYFSGWLLWNPTNRYTESALQKSQVDSPSPTVSTTPAVSTP